MDFKAETRVFFEKLKCDAKRHLFEQYEWIVKNNKVKVENHHQSLLDHQSSPDAKTAHEIMHEYHLQIICGNYDEAVAKIALKESYEKLFEDANENLGIYNVVRLTVTNNYAIFLFEVLGKKEQGKEVLEQAYKDYQVWEADSNRQPTLDDVQRAKNSKDIVGLIYENSKLWEAIIAQEEEKMEDNFKSTVVIK